jgi:hypothetical protein
MPLQREEYILDVTTELQKNQQVYYLIFCRSVWFFPMRLESDVYVEVVFNQIAPDYLEGLLLVMPGQTIPQDGVVSSKSSCNVNVKLTVSRCPVSVRHWQDRVVAAPRC